MVRSVRRLRAAWSGAICVALACAAPQPAEARFTVCNAYPFKIFLAYGKLHRGNWTAFGWYNFDPGRCEVIDSAPIQNRYLYIYIEATDGEGSDGAPAFDGLPTRTVDMCVNPDAAFTLRNSDDCAARGYEARPFHEVDTQGYRQYRLRLFDTD